jgi:hypothetical protein
MPSSRAPADISASRSTMLWRSRSKRKCSRRPIGEARKRRNDSRPREPALRGPAGLLPRQDQARKAGIGLHHGRNVVGGPHPEASCREQFSDSLLDRLLVASSAIRQEAGVDRSQHFAACGRSPLRVPVNSNRLSSLEDDALWFLVMHVASHDVQAADPRVALRRSRHLLYLRIVNRSMLRFGQQQERASSDCELSALNV